MLQQHKTVVIIFLVMSLWLTHWYFTNNLPTRPIHAHAAQVQQQIFAPTLNIIADSDGTLLISAGGIENVQGNIYANIIGPSHHIGGASLIAAAMTYSDTSQSHVATISGFAPKTSHNGGVVITTTNGLKTGLVEYNVTYLPLSASFTTIGTADGNMELQLLNSETIPHNTSITTVPSFTPFGPLPMGYRFIGSNYNISASATTTSDKPMNLRLYYNEASLKGAALHTLAIFRWDTAKKEWVKVGGTPSLRNAYLSVTTYRFGPYALMATTAWSDGFDNLSGLSYPEEVSNTITIGGQGNNSALVLSGSSALSGVAVSKPITPMNLIYWDTLTYTYNANPPTTTLQVDIVDTDNNLVMRDVKPGMSLVDIPFVQQNTVLKLRATLSSTVAGISPELYDWNLSWQATDTQPPTFTTTYSPTNSALITPTLGVVITMSRPLFEWLPANDNIGVVSYTIVLTRNNEFFQQKTITQSNFRPNLDLPEGHYWWTVQARDATNNETPFEVAQYFVIKNKMLIYLPHILRD